MDHADVDRLHREFLRDGAGTISREEAKQFLDLVRRHRPRSFIEIGTSSGLSAGLFALMLEANGGERFCTVDWSETFMGDRTQPVGFLLDEIYPGGRVRATRLTSTISTAVPGLGETFEMGFVDADHRHPWPLIDTLSLHPVLDGVRLLAHDDLNLYKSQPRGRGIGPKFLYDGFPDSHKTRFAGRGNVFVLDMSIDQAHLEQIAADLFLVPWTMTSRMSEETLASVRSVLAAHYGPELAAAFETGYERYGGPVNARTRGRS